MFINVIVKGKDGNIPWIINTNSIIGIAKNKDDDYFTIYFSDGGEIETVESSKSIYNLINKINIQDNVESDWISVDDRLPLSLTEVIVSCHDDHGDTSYDYTTVGWLTTQSDYWIVNNEVCGYVVAWMPLPKPYDIGK